MEWRGNLRKLTASESSNSEENVSYALKGAVVKEPLPAMEMADWIGQFVKIEFTGRIHCRITGQLIRKSFGEGMSYAAWMEHPSATPSVFRPELSRIHEGIALRDFDWENEHHNQPHYVYLAQTSGLKVGVTRCTNIPSRWHDQGAVGAVPIVQTPYRQLAGEIEVKLKSILSDKTNYRQMLQDVQFDPVEMLEWVEHCFEELGSEYEPFFVEDFEPKRFKYPVLKYPDKITSKKLEKAQVIQGMLLGIKGQYLIFESGEVLNVRSHSGYEVIMTG
ncbi:MAG: DUF2797 domain-containing protein [Flavobacteriales bacterium]